MCIILNVAKDIDLEDKIIKIHLQQKEKEDAKQLLKFLEKTLIGSISALLIASFFSNILFFLLFIIVMYIYNDTRMIIREALTWNMILFFLFCIFFFSIISIFLLSIKVLTN